jgi:hypothetical protein
MNSRLSATSIAFCVLLAAIETSFAETNAGSAEKAGLPAEFRTLCDFACTRLNSPDRKVPFYNDSYAVRALCVAFDLTGEKQYLETSTTWCDRMVDFQDQMKPVGAYYMNYGRKPGADQGDWYVADSSSIGLGILTTAFRCRKTGDEARYQRYLRSVRSFVKLTMDNYVGPGGGITDGLWPKFNGEWWCSSGIFASLGLMLYAETGEEAYRSVSLNAVDWLNRLDIAKAEHISFKEAAPTVLMYVFEAYSTAAPYLEPNSQRMKGALSQWDFALDWMVKNQGSRGVPATWNYQSQWGSKLGGLPFHMYVCARNVPGHEQLKQDADKELRWIGERVSKPGDPQLSQLSVFAMMSYAEQVQPGAIYRTSKRP